MDPKTPGATQGPRWALCPLPPAVGHVSFSSGKTQTKFMPGPEHGCGEVRLSPHPGLLTQFPFPWFGGVSIVLAAGLPIGRHIHFLFPG